MVQSHLQDDLMESGFSSFGDNRLMKLLLEELSYADGLTDHEGRNRRYGAIVVSTRHDLVLTTTPRDMVAVDSIDICRKLADGCYSFVLRTPSRSYLLRTTVACSDEYSLFTLRDEFLKPFPLKQIPPRDLGIVQLRGDRNISVFGPNQIAHRVNNKWRIKPYKYSYVEGVHLSGKLGSEEMAVIRELVSLCVHGLSPRGIGATIVYKRTRGKHQGYSPLPSYHIGDVPDLSVDDLRWHPSIIEILAHTDGAMLVDRFGRISQIGVRLNAPEAPRRKPNSDGGMRMVSAKEYSNTYTDCVVLACSSTGQLHVFMNGSEVPPVDPVKPGFQFIRQWQCKRCRKTFMLGGVAKRGTATSSPRCPCCDGLHPMRPASDQPCTIVLSRLDRSNCYSSVQGSL